MHFPTYCIARYSSKVVTVQSRGINAFVVVVVVNSSQERERERERERENLFAK